MVKEPPLRRWQGSKLDVPWQEAMRINCFLQVQRAAAASCFIGAPVEIPYAGGNLFFFFFFSPWQVGLSTLAWRLNRSSPVSASPTNRMMLFIIFIQCQISFWHIPQTCDQRIVANGANPQLFSSVFVSGNRSRSAQQVYMWQTLHQSALRCIRQERCAQLLIHPPVFCWLLRIRRLNRSLKISIKI